MAMSNKFGALVLSTGNKSELAVGYCTLYGDMVGGLAVISDVPKTLVYRLSAYVNSRRQGDSAGDHRESRRRPNCVRIKKIPTRFRHTMCWMRFSKTYVEESHFGRADCSRAHNFDLELVRRVIRMVERSEYKRQQAAPGIKISAKAFGYGRRFPIAAKSE